MGAHRASSIKAMITKAQENPMGLRRTNGRRPIKHSSIKRNTISPWLRAN